jgi:hypothetical protein
MGWLWFLLLVVVAGGIYLYWKLSAMEREIRREQATARSIPDESGDEVVKPDVAPPIFKEQVKLEPAEPDEEEAAAPGTLEEGLLRMITELPGMLQTELYELFPGEERKQLQALLLKMDRNGVIRRERKENSYRVFPA